MFERTQRQFNENFFMRDSIANLVDGNLESIAEAIVERNVDVEEDIESIVSIINEFCDLVAHEFTYDEITCAVEWCQFRATLLAMVDEGVLSRDVVSNKYSL